MTNCAIIRLRSLAAILILTACAGESSPTDGDEPSGGAGGSSEMGGEGGEGETGGMGGSGGETPEPMAMFPCTTDCKVLVAGDGLAAGTGSGPDKGDGEGFRGALATALGNKFSFVGAMGTPKHEGQKGKKAAELLEPIGASVEMHKPDLVVLSVGSEDIFAFEEVGLEIRVMSIVDKIIELAPNAGIVVTSPPNWSGALTATTKAHGLALAKAIKVKTDAGHHIRFVGLHSFFCNVENQCKTTFPSNDPHFAAAPYPSAKGYAEIAKSVSATAKALMQL